MENVKTSRPDVYEAYMKDKPSCSEDHQRQERSFITPNKKMKQGVVRTHSPPEIPTQNRFSVLQEAEKPMEITDPLPMQEESRNIKKEKPPPIIIRDKKNWPAICQLLKNLDLESDKNFNDQDGIKVFYNDMETYKKCLEQLEQHKIEYFTHKTNTEKEIRAIFKGVAEEFSIDDITKDLRSKGFHPRVVARFQKQDKTSMSMILCIVPESDQEITKITSIMDVQVKFEHQRKRARTGQCYNCQEFGHTAHTCRYMAVCRHCAGNHESRAHPNEDNIPSKCSNCGGEHKSNYQGCPKFPIYEKKERNNTRRPPRPQEEKNYENRKKKQGQQRMNLSEICWMPWTS
ncbi:hypothetical protein JTB14_006486 [Gonioctena quinquepunctata]|nr:hypothetical protein JTB14_006486 [Gonioctena quinquepunctata]